MARRSKAEPNRRRLDDVYIRNTTERMTWDTQQGGLVLQVHPGGSRTFKVVYRHKGRLRWYTIDRYAAVGLKEARETAKGKGCPG